MTDHLFFEPADVWLFRDGRPFTAGNDHAAHSIFPPYPSVMQGAIRSYQLIVQKVDLNNKKLIEQAVGTADDFKDLRLKGPFIGQKHADKVKRYYPLPADAISISQLELDALFGAGKVTASNEANYVKPVSLPETLPPHIKGSVADLSVLALNNDLVKPGGKRLWLDEVTLWSYLGGAVVQATLESDLFVRETRPGIAQNADTHTTFEGALFEVDFIRPQKDVGLIVDMEGYDWSKLSSGVLKLGGEHKAAYISHCNGCDLPEEKEISGMFKVYFATPTYFDQGWQPQDWSKFFSGPVELVAAAISRYEAMGGFDYAAGFHKPSRRFVPAGSMYYLKPTKDPVHLACENHAITDYGAEIGFGQIIIRHI
jgi:CRISPR-associated protein Cmr3